MRTRQLVVALGLLFTSLVSSSATAQQDAVRLVTIERGDLPIILSAPHGGSEAIPIAPARKGEGVDRFKNKPDSFTDQLAEKLADALEKKLGRRPYTVIARFHRKYVDANRPRKLAYESEEAKAVYDTYHRALAEARREVIERWGHGILLDIHGQGAAPEVIFRGTQNGKTTSHLLSRFGRDAVVGDSSLFGQLSQHGFQIDPAIDSSTPEHDAYDGGFIVVNYGSGAGGTVDAIQLELGRSLRSPDANTATAEKLANAITAFANDYLPKAEQFQEGSIFADDFSDGKRDGWFEVDDDYSTLSVNSKSGQLSSCPELSFTASDTSSLKSFATHFSEVTLKQPGDFVTLQFDARHSNVGFVNRGFRFGLFDSGGTRFSGDGDLDTKSISLDDDGYFVMLDLGVSTESDSAVIRENNSSRDMRLWNGSTIEFDDNDGSPDPLIFTRDKSYTYTLTLKPNEDGNLGIVLSNNVSGEDGALTGTSKLTPTLTFDTIYFGINGSTADFSIDNVIVTNNLTAAAQSSTGKIRVGVYVDEGAGPSVKDLLFALGKFQDVSIKRLKADDTRSGGLADLDLLIHPGGSGGGQGRHLEEGGRDAIRDFVRDGGGYIGICAGSYLASADYSWSLNILDAKVVDRKHWNRGNGTVDITITDAGQQLLRTESERLAIHYAQGPLLAPGNRPDIDDYEVMATFKTEIAKNGAPKGVMKGTTAIAKGQYGRGRVVCFSPHPEMTRGLEVLVEYAINHAKRNRSPETTPPEKQPTVQRDQ